MVRTKWYGQNGVDKMVYGQYGQNGMNKMVQFYILCIEFNIHLVTKSHK